MLIRYLEPVTLKKATKAKQANGTYIDSYTKIAVYNVQKQTLESEVDAQVYGADINKMLRLVSPYNRLEKYLLTKLSNESDNISKYYIFDNDIKYKVVAVTPSKVDISILGSKPNDVSL